MGQEGGEQNIEPGTSGSRPCQALHGVHRVKADETERMVGEMRGDEEKQDETGASLSRCRRSPRARTCIGAGSRVAVRGIIGKR
jgi:hypothetical protein